MVRRQTSTGLSTARWPERVVVIGAGGFVGGAALRRLGQIGVPAAGIAREDIDLLADGAAERLAAMMRPGDAVVAAAAVAPVKTAAMLVDNIRLIETIAGALRLRPPVYALNIGSDAVFADSAAPLTEASCKAPTSLHGVMHLTREIMLAEALDGVPFATLRPTLIYGVGDPHNGYGPNRFQRQIAAGRPVELFGEGEEQRDHIWIEDVAELAVRMIGACAVGGLNAATGETISFHEIAERLGGVIRSLPRSGPMPHNGWRAFDISAMRAAFPDFQPTPIRKGLCRAWRPAPALEPTG